MVRPNAILVGRGATDCRSARRPDCAVTSEKEPIDWKLWFFDGKRFPRRPIEPLLSGDDQSALAVHHHGAKRADDTVVLEAIARGESAKSLPIETAQAIVGGKPECALSVQADVTNVRKVEPIKARVKSPNTFLRRGDVEFNRCRLAALPELHHFITEGRGI